VFVSWFGLVSVASARDGPPISKSKVLKHPADYQDQVVTVEGRARAVSTLPVHRGTRNCGGGAVYDSQMFALQDKSGSIGISTTGACLPNMTKPVVQNEHLRVRGVVMTDRDNPKGLDPRAINRPRVAIAFLLLTRSLKKRGSGFDIWTLEGPS